MGRNKIKIEKIKSEKIRLVINKLDLLTSKYRLLMQKDRKDY